MTTKLLEDVFHWTMSRATSINSRIWLNHKKGTIHKYGMTQSGRDKPRFSTTSIMYVNVNSKIQLLIVKICFFYKIFSLDSTKNANIDDCFKKTSGNSSKIKWIFTINNWIFDWIIDVYIIDIVENLSKNVSWGSVVQVF